MPATSTLNGQPTARPTRKMTAVAAGSSVAGAASTVLMWLVFRHVETPTDVAAAMATLIGSAVTAAGGFLSGYLTPPHPSEGVTTVP